MLVFRLPLWILESLLQVLLGLRYRFTSTVNLDTSPVFWHEMSWPPLPLLGNHIELTAATHPGLARRALDQCAVIPGQRRTGKKVLERLQRLELIELANEGHFDDFLGGKTLWQAPGSDEADSTLVGLREAARSIRAGRLASTRDLGLRRYEEALDRVRGLSTYRRGSKVSVEVEEVVSAWTRAIESLIAEVEAEGPRLLPNPFRAGEALEPRLGRELFRGREDVVARLERLLADPDRAASIALLAPRRCGKTSLLKMLPLLLPDAVCVFFDLQGHPCLLYTSPSPRD